ncbi:MAG: hypothetical protein ABH879_02130 [archaeon]
MKWPILLFILLLPSVTATDAVQSIQMSDDFRIDITVNCDQDEEGKAKICSDFSIVKVSAEDDSISFALEYTDSKWHAIYSRPAIGANYDRSGYTPAEINGVGRATDSYVYLSPNRRTATVSVSVYPDRMTGDDGVYSGGIWLFTFADENNEWVRDDLYPDDPQKSPAVEILFTISRLSEGITHTNKRCSDDGSGYEPGTVLCTGDNSAKECNGQTGDWENIDCVVCIENNCITSEPPNLETSDCSAADFNGDNKIGVADIKMYIDAFSAKSGDANWNADIDLDDDGQIDFDDYFRMADVVGCRCGESDPRECASRDPAEQEAILAILEEWGGKTTSTESRQISTGAGIEIPELWLEHYPSGGAGLRFTATEPGEIQAFSIVISDSKGVISSPGTFNARSVYWEGNNAPKGEPDQFRQSFDVPDELLSAGYFYIRVCKAQVCGYTPILPLAGKDYQSSFKIGTLSTESPQISAQLDTSYTLNEGETKHYRVNKKDYLITNRNSGNDGVNLVINEQIIRVTYADSKKPLPNSTVQIERIGSSDESAGFKFIAAENVNDFAQNAAEPGADAGGNAAAEDQIPTGQAVALDEAYELVPNNPMTYNLGGEDYTLEFKSITQHGISISVGDSQKMLAQGAVEPISDEHAIRTTRVAYSQGMGPDRVAIEFLKKHPDAHCNVADVNSDSGIDISDYNSIKSRSGTTLRQVGDRGAWARDYDKYDLNSDDSIGQDDLDIVEYYVGCECLDEGYCTGQAASEITYLAYQIQMNQV